MIFYMLSGTPGSGKTTKSIEIASVTNSVLLCYDDIRNKLKLPHDETLKNIIQTIICNLTHEENVVYDSVNRRKDERIKILNSIRDIACKKIAVVISTSLEECLYRNSQRSGYARLPDFVVKDIHNRFEPHTLDEGWDEIIVINNDKDIENLKNNIENNIKNLNLL